MTYAAAPTNDEEDEDDLDVVDVVVLLLLLWWWWLLVVGCLLFLLLLMMMMMMMMNTPLTSASGKPAMTPRLGSQLGHAICRVVSASRPEKIGAFHHPKVGVNPFTISITNCEQIWIQYMIVYDNSSLVWDNSTIVYNYHYYSPKVGGKIGKISMEFS